MPMKCSPFQAIVFASIAPLAANAAGLPEEGRIVAERWCAACHQVTPDQNTASADAPSFMTIADGLDGEESLEALAGFLADPHPVMPDMSLTRQEIRNLVAYIGSLNP